MKNQPIDDDDREQWVANDEGLYDLWRSSGLSEEEFVRQNRELIDEVIHNVRDGGRPAHYLKYQ